MSAFLLDTNAWVAYLRQKEPALLARVGATPPDEIKLCSVVVSELVFGAYRSPPAYKAGNLALVDGLRARFASLPLDDAAAGANARIRADLAAKGTPIGPFDSLIAAIALANGLTVVTHNTREFSRVVGLQLEDWQV